MSKVHKFFLCSLLFVNCSLVFADLHETVLNATGGTLDNPIEIILFEDIVLDEPLIINDGVHVRLVPEGNRTITRGNGNIEYPLLWISGSNASLSLGKPGMENELIVDGAYLNTPPVHSHAPIAVVNGLDTKLIMHDKVILQNNCNNGYALGTASMYQNGAGVYVRPDDRYGSAEFIMKGGIIRGNICDVQNSSPSGGGVFVSEMGIFIMEGGQIMCNAAYGPGGGVCTSGGGSFFKTGGVIYGSNAPKALRNTAGMGFANRTNGHAVYITINSSSFLRYRDDTVGENESLSFAGSHSGYGVFGDGENWQYHYITVQRRRSIRMLIAIIAAAALAVPILLFTRKKIKARHEAYIEKALASHAAAKPGAELTPREKEVFDLLLTDIPVKQIAYKLQLAYSGVNKRITGIYAKLGVKSRLELIRKYRKK